MKWKLAVIGDPIAHSLSPVIQGQIMEILGVSGEYKAVHVKAEELAGFMEYARENLHGFNVTIPHKGAVIPFLDEIDPYAQSCGAVNTVRIRDGKMTGFNTDGDGIRAALEQMGAPFAGSRVALLGAGGAARSICRKALDCGADAVRVFCRRPEQGEAILPAGSRGEVLPFSALSAETCGAWADIIINATPLGMSGTAADFAGFSFLDGGRPAVCDIVYKPAETSLLKACRERGLVCRNGLGMLVYQAVYAFRIFTGLSFDEDDLAVFLLRRGLTSRRGNSETAG